MSHNIQRVRDWLNLLQDDTTALKQAKALLSTASEDQILALTEVLFNFVNNCAHLPQEISRKLKNRKWKFIAKPQKSLKAKKKTFVKFAKEIILLLHALQPFLAQHLE